MQKVDMTLLFKSFALCGLLLGSMISHVFCEEPAGDPTVVDVDVPKSKEVTFTKADLVGVINGLGLKYTQTQYDYASELCPSSATATLSYAPRIVDNDVVFYLPKDNKFESYLAGNIDLLKDFLNQASSKHADYTTKFQPLNSPVKDVLYTDFQAFLKNFKFSGKKFVRKDATETGFDLNGDNFRDEIVVRLSGNLDDIFKNVQQEINRGALAYEKDKIIDYVMNIISASTSTPPSPQDKFVTLKDLFKKCEDLKKPAESIGVFGKIASIGASMFSKKDAVNFADFKDHNGKFLIKFIEVKPETEPIFEFLSAVVNESNPESNIKKVLEKILEKDKPNFKKTIEQFINFSMDEDFSKTTLKKDEFNKKTNEKFPKQVDFNVTEADIADSFLKLNIPNVDGSDAEILKKYLNYLKDQKHFDNLKGLKIENVLKAFFLLVKKEENINKYFDAHPKSMNMPDDKPKDDEPKDDEPDDDEQQKEKQKEQQKEKQQKQQENQEQQENMQNQNVQQSTGGNTQGDQSNAFQVTGPTKSNSKNLWLKLTLSIGGFILVVFVPIGSYVLFKHIKSKRTSEESQVV